MPKPKDESKIGLIYDAALKLVLETGYGNLKISKVAKLAGVATGTIYTYFKNKNDLINGLFKELKKTKMEEVFNGFSPDLSFYEGFKLLWCNYLNAGLQKPARNLFIDLYEQSELLNKESKAISLRSHERLYYFLEEASKAQIIKSIDVKVMAAQLMGGANEVARLYIGKTKLIDNKLVEQCFEMAWQSIRK